LADDKATLDPVIYEAYISIKNKTGNDYDLIVTMQPTSPLLKSESLDNAIKMMLDNHKIDTIISATNDTHLTWKKENEQYFPNYKERVNRQYLEPVFKETGGFLITRNNVISENGRIGKNVSLYELSDGERIDIDSYEDWALCSYYLNRKKIALIIDSPKETQKNKIFDFINATLNHQVDIFISNQSENIVNILISMNYKIHYFNELMDYSSYDLLIVYSQKSNISLTNEFKKNDDYNQAAVYILKKLDIAPLLSTLETLK
jgi:hypothetical protein